MNSRTVVDDMNDVRDKLRKHAQTQYNKPFGQQDLDDALMQQYDDTRTRMIKTCYWPEWCERQGFAQSHTAIDYYA